MYNQSSNRKNIDIRIKCLETGIKLWQIADALSVSPETITRRLRKELSDVEKNEILKTIEEIQSKGENANE